MLNMSVVSSGGNSSAESQFFSAQTLSFSLQRIAAETEACEERVPSRFRCRLPEQYPPVLFVEHDEHLPVKVYIYSGCGVSILTGIRQSSLLRAPPAKVLFPATLPV